MGPKGAAMRWDQLFADLEAQADALDLLERGGEIDERARIELSRVALFDRLRPGVGQVVRVRCPAGVTVGGRLVRVGAQWLLVDEAGGRQALVVASAIMVVSGLGRLAASPGSQGVVESRLGLAHALRGIARDRSPVRLELVDGTSLDGTIDRVGADFVELAAHAAGEARRRAEVRELVVVATAALAVVRRDSG
jgi:hypothetical protein